MPADADYLCEYFISSSFGSKSKLNTTSSSSLNSLLSTAGPSTASNTSPTQKSISSSNSTQSSYLETIEFAKYDKDKMEYLKSKYSTLSEQNTKKPVVTTNGSTTSPTSNNKDTTAISTGSKLDLNWSRIRRIGIGLLNLGNNCYLNATLQCLAYTPPLSQWLVQRPHSPGCKFKQVKGFCALCEVERIIYELFHGHGFAKPNSLCFNIKKISHVFGVGTQEDASEFFTTLLESMAKSIKYGQQQHQQQGNKKTMTILDEIFSFQFRSRITCGNCGRLSDTVENTNSWPIDVKYTQELSKGIAHFLREEVLDGENAYKCDKCNRKVRATKKYSVRTAPNILVIQLKRFDFSYAGKLSHFVSYPETLTLKTLLPSSSSEVGHSPAAAAAIHAMADSSPSGGEKSSTLRSVSYKLYGVLVHLGHTSHSGHYYSYVRAPNDTWYKADDQRVNVVQQNEALRQNAYILFYSKVTSGAVETASAGITAMPSVPLPRPLVTAGVNTQHNSTHFIKNSPSQPTKPQSYIPQVIRETTSPAAKPSTNGNSLTPSNYLNSLTSPSTSISNSSSSLLRPDHEKVVFKLKNSISSTTSSVAKPATVELPVTSLTASTDQKVDKKSNKLVDRVKKVKRLIKKQRQAIKSEPDLQGEEKKEKWAKLKMLKKKLKKLVKRKEEKKAAKKSEKKTENGGEETEQHLSRKRSLETSSDEKKNKKKKHSQDTEEPLNGLALLKQYDSSPSPARSSRSPSLTSLSSMSSASANLNQLSSSSASPVKTTSSPGTLYSYNPKSKVPDVVTNGNKQQSPPSAAAKTTTTPSPLEQMKEKSSLSQLKTWSSDTTSSLKSSHNTDYTEYNEDDEYNEDFDRPMSRNQGMPKFNSKKQDYSGFHLYTHGNHQQQNGGQYNKYNNYNKKPYYNGNSSNSNYQNGGGGGKWNGQQRFNNYHNGYNNNNRFHYNKNGRGGGGGGGYRGGKGGVFNAFHHQR